MGEYKTPGVYIKEKSAFGNSVVEAETAIPAFIGITEKAVNGNDNLTFMPWKISSMTEFITYFGNAPEFEFEVDIKARNKEKEIEITPADFYQYDVTEGKDKIYSFQLNFDKTDETDENTGKTNKTPYYSLFRHMQLFFANGGGACYVVSIGSYEDKTTKILKVETALNALEKVQEVTMIVIPEAVESTSCANIQQKMMTHCGEMKNRFAILDVPTAPKGTPLDQHAENFQNTVTNYFSYGAAYYPWLNTSVVSERDLDGKMFEWKENAFTFSSEFGSIDKNYINIFSTFFPATVTLTEEKEKIINGHTFKYNEVTEEDDIYADNDEEKKNKIGKITKIKEEEEATKKVKSLQIKWNAVCEDEKQTLHQALLSTSPLYKEAIKSLLTKLNLLPPSAAMAGIYTMVDKSRGVWKAPANVTLNYVNSPAEDIDDDEQANLNAPMNGKAINVIRTFRGEGVKVWGARTLDGNSLDWRYINVRRTLLFLEESVKNAARAYVFEPNVAGTWINMKCMIENFLRGVWKRGGLVGASPEDAYEVHVGLGDTMTGEDILEGIMRITVLVAVSHPAEFIEITFQQQMQKS